MMRGNAAMMRRSTHWRDERTAERREERVTTREGTSLGPYRLLRRIGGGGAGEVYLAQGPADPTGSNPSGQVAVKVLNGAASEPTARAIAQQAQAAGQLQQAHIIPFYGIVEDQGALGVVIAYAPGGSLGETLRANRADGARKLELPLEGGIVARLVTQLAQALGAAHAAGMAHGDLKPSNVFVRTSPGGRPLAVVSDFGQSVITSGAAALAARGATGEQAAWVASQLLFAAPEQLRGQTLPASDQYALAALAYLLLTGQPPVSGDAASLPRNIASEEATAPSQRNPALSPEADAALLHALAKDPTRRFPDVELFAQAVDAALAAPVSAGQTQQFARLAGSSPGMARPGATRDPAASGIRVIDRSGASRAGRTRAAATPAMPNDAPPSVSRRLSVITGVAMLMVLLAFALTFRAISGGIVLPHITLGGGLGGGAQPTANAQATATAQSAARQLTSATSGTPVFSDALTSNSHHWATQGKAVFFAADGLHMANTSVNSVLTEDVPEAAAPLSDEAVQVTLKSVRGGSGDLAGLRFFVRPGAGGSDDYYCYLIAPQGSFEVWLHHSGNWDFVARGYSSAIRTTPNATNTIAVIAHSGAGNALLFANGQYLATIKIGLRAVYTDAPTAGTGGLIVMDNGAEFAFTHLAIYQASGS